MKNNFSRMTGASFGLSFDTAAGGSGGGAAAVAAPPAAAAPAGAPPAPAAATPPAPTKTGFFQGLTRAAAPKPPAAPPTTQPDPATAAPAKVETAAATGAKVQVLSDDKKQVLFEGTQSEADEFVKKNTPPPAAVAAAGAALVRPFMGRADITTIEAAEDLYRKSGAEALRLRDAEKAAAAKVVDTEARLAAVTKELELARQTPATAELSKEQLAALWKENPIEAAEYMQKQRDRVSSTQAAKERAELEVRTRAENAQAVAKQTVATWEAMKKDSKAYPKFEEMIPRIDAIYESSVRDGKSPFDSNPDAPKLMYTQAMGEIYLELLSKGIEVKADAAETARLKAEADAAAARTAAGGGDGAAAPDTRTQKQKDDDAWRAQMRGTAPKPLFKERAAT